MTIENGVPIPTDAEPSARVLILYIFIIMNQIRTNDTRAELVAVPGR